MKDPIKAEVWMRLENADQMHRVGYITYDDIEIENGQITVEQYTQSIIDFVKAMNRVLAERQEDDDE